MKKILILSLVIIIGTAIFALFNRSSTQIVTQNESADTYNPTINPSDFSTIITNPYFYLPVGRIMRYEKKTPFGIEKTVLEIEPNTQKIYGVDTLVYRDKVYLNSQLVEDTKDYLAEDSNGNVWYFGEAVDNYEDGKLLDHEGSWIAGENGALPGIWIKAQHTAGDVYKQEYYPGIAEDVRQVMETNVSVETSLMTYPNCVKMYDWTPLDQSSREYKYYCPQVGALVLSENLETEERSELVEIENPTCVPLLN